MRQADLNRAVSRATGESVSTIQRLGFGLAEPDESFEPDPDEQQTQQHATAERIPRAAPVAA